MGIDGAEIPSGRTATPIRAATSATGGAPVTSGHVTAEVRPYCRSDAICAR